MRRLVVPCLGWLLVSCAPQYVTLPPSPIRLLSTSDPTPMVWEATIDSVNHESTTSEGSLVPEDFGLDLPPSSTSGPLNGLFLLRDAPTCRVAQRYGVIITGYASVREQTDNSPHLTANGHLVAIGVVACNWLPFGTRVRFSNLFGTMVFTVDDRLNERYNSTPNVDIWFPSTTAAARFGLHRSMMEVLGPPD